MITESPHRLMLIKPLLVAVLAAALCILLKSFVLPYAIMLLTPESWSGAWMFWISLLLSGFVAGLMVVRVLPTQRYYVALILVPVFCAMTFATYAFNRCNTGQLAAMNQLSAQTWTTLGNPDEQLPKTTVDLTEAPGVTQDDEGYSYSCVAPGETRDYFRTVFGIYGACLLGLLSALLLTNRRGRAPMPRQSL